MHCRLSGWRVPLPDAMDAGANMPGAEWLNTRVRGPTFALQSGMAGVLWSDPALCGCAHITGGVARPVGSTWAFGPVLCGSACTIQRRARARCCDEYPLGGRHPQLFMTSELRHWPDGFAQAVASCVGRRFTSLHSHAVEQSVGRRRWEGFRRKAFTSESLARWLAPGHPRARRALQRRPWGVPLAHIPGLRHSGSVPRPNGSRRNISGHLGGLVVVRGHLRSGLAASI